MKHIKTCCGDSRIWHVVMFGDDLTTLKNGEWWTELLCWTVSSNSCISLNWMKSASYLSIWTSSRSYKHLCPWGNIHVHHRRAIKSDLMKKIKSRFSVLYLVTFCGRDLIFKQNHQSLGTVGTSGSPAAVWDPYVFEPVASFSWALQTVWRELWKVGGGDFQLKGIVYSFSIWAKVVFYIPLCKCRSDTLKLPEIALATHTSVHRVIWVPALVCLIFIHTSITNLWKEADITTSDKTKI